MKWMEETTERMWKQRHGANAQLQRDLIGEARRKRKTRLKEEEEKRRQQSSTEEESD